VQGIDVNLVAVLTQLIYQKLPILVSGLVSFVFRHVSKAKYHVGNFQDDALVAVDGLEIGDNFFVDYL
jgi:hypothetical protein